MRVIDPLQACPPVAADVRLLGAFKYRPDFDVDPAASHQLYSAEAEYARMGIPNKDWQFTTENFDFSVGRAPSLRP